jgi:hypothetical protein
MSEETEPDEKQSRLQRRRARVEYLAFFAQIISALAVVISLIFVGLQLQAGNTVMLRNESNATMTQWSAFRASIYSDRETARLFQAGMDGVSPLDEADQLRFLYAMREHAWATYQIWDRAKRSLVRQRNFDAGAAPDFLKVICTPGGAQAWAAIRTELPPAYVTDLEQISISYGGDHNVSCVPEDD